MGWKKLKQISVRKPLKPEEIPNETQYIPSRIKPMKTTCQLLEIKVKDKILRAERDKQYIFYREAIPMTKTSH